MGIDYGEEFDSEDEAQEYADMLCGAYNQGHIDDYLSNPGDYEGYTEPDYEIFEE